MFVAIRSATSRVLHSPALQDYFLCEDNCEQGARFHDPQYRRVIVSDVDGDPVPMPSCGPPDRIPLPCPQACGPLPVGRFQECVIAYPLEGVRVERKRGATKKRPQRLGGAEPRVLGGGGPHVYRTAPLRISVCGCPHDRQIAGRRRSWRSAPSARQRRPALPAEARRRALNRTRILPPGGSSGPVTSRTPFWFLCQLIPVILAVAGLDTSNCGEGSGEWRTAAALLRESRQDQ
jgi:hypothetical protein